MFEVLIVKPIFNLLVFIYALLPGHNFGLSLILFTILVRFLMWPLIKKQLHHAKAMRELQPEIKRIKQATKGNRQQESLMIMELYKEREISPFGSLGVMIVQLLILLGLYSGLRRVVDNPHAIIDFAYPFLQDLGWLQTLSQDIARFDETLLGVVDLTRAALSQQGIYWPAMIIVVGSAAAQYFQTIQLMPKDKEARGLRRILREASEGKQADSAELNAAVTGGMRYVIPILILIFTVNLPSALGLYWLVSGVTAFFQQSHILKQDEVELEAVGDTPKKVIEGEVISTKTSKPSKKKKAAPAKKRRK